MEKWFFINISSITISDGYPDFYFGAIKENCYYFKRKFPSQLDFEGILYDRIGSVLLKDGVPDYNLVFIISKPFMYLMPDIAEKEKAITPFLYYLNDLMEGLSNFVGKTPSYKFVFELDEKVGAENIGVKGSDYESIHWLDHQPSDAPGYMLADSWPVPLKKTLEKITTGNSNLQYLARLRNIYFCRISFFNKKNEDYLHYLFSFLQLFITDGAIIKQSILTNNSLNELDFEGNNTVFYFNTFCKQVVASLDQLKRKIGQNSVDAELIIAEEKEGQVKDRLGAIAKQVSPEKIMTDDISCKNLEPNIKQWKGSFDQFAKNLPRSFHDFNTFLNNKYNLIDTSKKLKTGDLQTWKGLKLDLTEEHKSLSNNILPLSFDENKFLKDWKKELSSRFIEIEKDIQRCPNQNFMLMILVGSILFYSIAFYAVISKVGVPTDYLILFLVVTIIYLALSFHLFFKYKRESINQVKRKVAELETFNSAKVSTCMKALKQKTANQINIYKLGILNQNISVAEKSLLFFEDLDQKIEDIRVHNSNISNIKINGEKNKDFDFDKEIEGIPNSIYSYIKVLDTKLEVTPIKLYKNLTDQNQDIKKLSNRNNALKAIKITQK